MSKLHIIYDTCDGQAEKIAQAMMEAAQCLGHEATAEDVHQSPTRLGSPCCDAIIIGGPIHAGKHSRELRDFIQANQAWLQTVPAAFFSVSLSAAGTEEQREEARRCMDEFLESVNFEPIHRTILAGALKYRKYGFIKRWIMQCIVRSAGGDTDTSRDYEYTKWPEVTAFVTHFLEMAGFDAFAAKSVGAE